MRNRWIVLYCVLAVTAGEAASAQTERHVCRLLKADEVTAGDKMLASSEGVGIDSLAKAGLVKAGPVQGLGDVACFSDLLPSLVLEGDMMLELNMALLQDPAAKFRPLAEKLLARAK